MLVNAEKPTLPEDFRHDIEAAVRDQPAAKWMHAPGTILQRYGQDRIEEIANGLKTTVGNLFQLIIQYAQDFSKTLPRQSEPKKRKYGGKMSEQEPGFVPEEEGARIEPTVFDLAEALKGHLSLAEFMEMKEMSLEDALGYAFTLLIEAGIEDPEAFLKEKGILE